MKNLTYPTTKNTFNLTILFIFINLGFGVLLSVLMITMKETNTEIIENVLFTLITIVSYLIIYKIIIRKSKISIESLFSWEKIKPELIFPFLLFSFGFLIISSEIDNLFNFILPMPEFLVNIFNDLIVNENIFFSPYNQELDES